MYATYQHSNIIQEFHELHQHNTKVFKKLSQQNQEFQETSSLYIIQESHHLVEFFHSSKSRVFFFFQDKILHV